MSHSYLLPNKADSQPRRLQEIFTKLGRVSMEIFCLAVILGEDLATYPTPAATIINQQRTSLCDTSESISELFYDLVHIT
jgi:hypothetical protein